MQGLLPTMCRQNYVNYRLGDYYNRSSDFSGNLNRLKEVVSAYPESEQKRVRIAHHDLKAELNPEISASIGKVDFISHLAAVLM